MGVRRMAYGVVVIGATAVLGGPASAQGGRGQVQPLPPALTDCTSLASAVRTVAANDARLRDWPNLARYREANHAVSQPTAVFMGDSITDIWQQPRYGDFFENPAYVDRGHNCRSYTHTIYIDGQPQTARGTACRNPDGTWTPLT